jgi:hypothetical protein
MFHSTALSPHTGRTIRRLSALQPRTLALMHGSSKHTGCSQALEKLANAYDDALTRAA